MKIINTNRPIINTNGVIPSMRLLDNTITAGFLNFIEKKDMKITVKKNAITEPLPPGYNIPAIINISKRK
jgi:hypothetical protein